jgi:hypothetical protein
MRLPEENSVPFSQKYPEARVEIRGTAVKHKPLAPLEYFEEFFYFNLF